MRRNGSIPRSPLDPWFHPWLETTSHHNTPSYSWLNPISGIPSPATWPLIPPSDHWPKGRRSWNGISSFFFRWSLAMADGLRFTLVLLGFTMVLLGLWILLGFTGFYWVLLGFTRLNWVQLGFTGLNWVLLGFAFKVLLGFIGFYWVLLGFIGLNWVKLGLTRFYLVLLCFIGFGVLLGFTGFYWVLLGFVGFY